MKILARLRSADSDRGLTLVEVMLSVALLTVVGGLVSTFVVATQRTTAATSTRLQNVDKGRLAMDAMAKALRVAVQPAQVQQQLGVQGSGAVASSTALTTATTTSVTFYADFGIQGNNTGPDLVTFSVTPNADGKTAKLTQSYRQPDPGSAPNWTYGCTVGTTGCVVVVRTLVPALALPAANTVFTYYDNAGNVLTPASGGLTPSQLITVDRVNFTLPVQTPNGYGIGANTVTSDVQLPNAVTGVIATPTPTAGG
ncbi:MAG: prepilin-type N-terminal cleavage/methylation domain-containing protein [Frankiaceae bacterium]|nr:prepilin-type N-terminal cleavage/methylation domain-containing protein [Frankiaceae bacterium]MBV9368412.1 prepilin-type N-terminal cleavage/methylation domain-containing protein [Frankiales bacterium]